MGKILVGSFASIRFQGQSEIVFIIHLLRDTFIFGIVEVIEFVVGVVMIIVLIL
jgi:hypothetical protein